MRSWLDAARRATDAVALTGARGIRLTGSRTLLNLLKERNHEFIEVTGVLERKSRGGSTDRLESRRKKKIGAKTTVSVGVAAEQGSDVPSPEPEIRLVVEGFEPISETCPV